jgi:hypothetical protein
VVSAAAGGRATRAGLTVRPLHLRGGRSETGGADEGTAAGGAAAVQPAPGPADDVPVETALALTAVVWVGIALLVAVVVGRSIGLADERAVGTGVDAELTTAALVSTR